MAKEGNLVERRGEEKAWDKNENFLVEYAKKFCISTLPLNNKRLKTRHSSPVVKTLPAITLTLL